MEQAPLLGGVKPQRKRWPFLLLGVLLIGLICAVASAKYNSHESALATDEMSQADMKLEIDTADENVGAAESPTKQNDGWMKTFFSESEEQNVAQDETTAAAAAETTAAAAPAEGGADTTAAAAAEEETTAAAADAAKTTAAAADEAE